MNMTLNGCSMKDAAADDAEAPAFGARSGVKCESCNTRMYVMVRYTRSSPLVCCGKPMVPAELIRCSSPREARDDASGSVGGVVYADEATGLKVRCIRGGVGRVESRRAAAVRPSTKVRNGHLTNHSLVVPVLPLIFVCAGSREWSCT